MDDGSPAQLNQLSRVLFDRASVLWQVSIGLELLAGGIGVWSALASLEPDAALASAVGIAALLVVAYALRYQFDGLYDIAETMRRQSVLSEGLGWPIGRAEFNDWRSRAGGSALRRVNENPRPDDYYETRQTQGAKCLAEMTFESAFWTKCLYRRLRGYILLFLIVAVIALAITISLAPLEFVSAQSKVLLVYAVYLIVPVLLTVDFLGIVFRLNRAVDGLRELERHLERVSEEQSPEIAETMRLVSEYNCIVAAGVAIPGWLFKLHHDEIQQSWK